MLGGASTLENIGDPGGDSLTNQLSCERNGVDIDDCIPVDESSHTPGMMRFAPDGTLFVSMGDAAHSSAASSSALRSLRLSSLSGKVLRINAVNGRGLADNPHFNGNANSNVSRVYARGLRNPFRLAVQPSTGDLFIGDVGWSTWEEVNASGPGANYGWPCFEGGNGNVQKNLAYSQFDTCQGLAATSVDAPAYAYNHNGGGASIIIGDFYSGQNYPGEYQGALFYGDYEDGRLNFVSFGPSGSIVSDTSLGDEQFGIVSMRRGPDGDIHMVKIAEGVIDALRFDESNRPPVARVTTSALFGPSPLTVSFDASTSFDPDGDPLSFLWDLDSGRSASGPTASRTFYAGTAADYWVTVTVSDENNTIDRKRVRVAVNQQPNVLPVISLVAPPSGTRVDIGDIVQLSASASDAEDGALSGTSLSWSAKLRHFGHVHTDFVTATGTQLALRYPDHGDNTFIEYCANATDSDGETTTVCRELRPNEVNILIDSVPQGIAVDWSGTTQMTPFTVRSPVGSVREVSVAQDQGTDGQFVSWSDGGGLSHPVDIGMSDLRLVARFSVEPQPEPITAVIVEPGVVDNVDRGYGFGESEHPDGIEYRFEASGTEPLFVSFRGYDIDTDDEVAIMLNNQLVGFARRGTSNKIAGWSRLNLTADQVLAGENVIALVPKSPPSRWGATRFSVFESYGEPVALFAGEIDRNPYGYFYGDSLRPAGLTMKFGAVEGSAVLTLVGYNISSAKEVAVSVNGKAQGYLRSTRPRKYSRNRFVISADDLSESNTIELRRRNPGGVWGVVNTLVVQQFSSCEINPGGDLCDALWIEPGDVDTIDHGSGFGDDSYAETLVYRFNSTREPLFISFKGYNVATEDALSVYVNGKAAGFATQGEPDTLAGWSRFMIALDDVRDGTNLVEIKSTREDVPWGVSQFSVLSAYGPTIDLTAGVRDTGSHGYLFGDSLHPAGLAATFGEVQGDAEIILAGYNINTATQVSVYVNNVFVGYLKKTLPRQSLANRLVVRSEILAERNVVEFRRRRAGALWGIRNLLVR